MKKKFTFLIAAIMLLTMSVIPMRMIGAEGDTHDFPQSISASLNNNATIDPIEIAAQTYEILSEFGFYKPRLQVNIRSLQKTFIEMK